MCVCSCIRVGVGKHRVMYGILGVIEQIIWIEIYNCVGSVVLGSSVVFLLESVLKEVQHGRIELLLVWHLGGHLWLLRVVRMM